MKKIEKSIELGGRKLTLATGHLAEQATGSCLASYGETVVLATVVSSKPREHPGYFPLYVEYRERLSAGGKIKGSRWVKRPGRPSDEEVLTARLIDRSIRPLFPKDYDKEVQVIVTVLSVDKKNTPDIVAGAAVSAAIAASEIPWEGPVGIIKVGFKEGKPFTNPLDEELESSDLDLFVSTAKDAIVMIEAGANQVSEKDILGGIKHGQKEGKKLVSFIEEFAKEVGVKKQKVKKEKVDSSIEKKVKDLSKGKIKDLIKGLATKEVGYSDLDAVRDAIKEEFEEEERKLAGKVFDELLKNKIRKMIFSGKRPDGRKPDEIRELSAQVEILPRTHGSGLFKRGQTQALTVSTLGDPSLEQLIETAEGEETKRYIHHYRMPPFSVGETGRVGWPSRREVGHGALAERALEPVIPAEKDFPYTIHVSTEILSSNGSTSMASVCGSTLALMDAGVPIKSAVAGIAMGLVIESEKKFEVLTDIVGLEDGNGDMDLKVAGTKEGVTILQLDVKTLNLNTTILEKALNQAKDAREKMLEVMKKAISKPRENLSAYAPKIKMIKVPEDKIGEVIGPGGKIIRSIIAETGAQVNIEDDGTVSITGATNDEVNSAVQKVEALVKEAEPGEVYEGEVKRIQPFGAFVEVLPGKEGLVHISDMSKDYVKEPSDKVSVGDKVQVRVKEIDNLGRINLSMILDPKEEKEKEKNKRRSSKRYKGRRKNKGRNQKRKSSGPHFPKSRLVDQEKKKDFSR